MSTPTPTHSEVFTDVINSMMQELHTIPHSVNMILHFLTNNNNIDSPVLAVIQHLALKKLSSHQIDALVPALARMTGLTSLSLPSCALSPHHLKVLFTECPALSKLESLDLSSVRALASEDLLLLSQSTTVTNLTSLKLSGCSVTKSRATAGPAPSMPWQDLGGLIALLLSPILKNLTHLNLSFTDISDPSVAITIATSPYLSDLASLDLSRNLLAPKGLAALAATTTLTNLTSLSLASNILGEESITELFSPASLLTTKLRSLNLSYANITLSSLEVVIKACPHLSELVLRGADGLGAAGAQLIATSMPNLTKLDLSSCRIGDEGYAALVASTTLSNLRELRLQFTPARPESVIALINSPVLANLVYLDLSNNDYGSTVLAAIAQSTSMPKLQHLCLRYNKTGDEGVIALAQSTTLTNLASLDLCSNDIGRAGLQALCTSPVASKLTCLRLSNNRALGNHLAAVLAAPSSTLYSLLTLDLLGTTIDDEGVLQLLATPNLDQLDVLSISDLTVNDSTRAAYLARFDDYI